MQPVVEAWNTFFHAPEAATTIAVFRILLASLLILDGILRAKDAKLFYGPDGMFSAEQYRSLIGRKRLSLFNHLPATHGVTHAVFLLHFIVLIALLLGFYTRTAAILSFLTLASLQHRNPYVNNGGDYFLRILLFLLCFSRAGEALSIDYWVASGGVSGIIQGTEGSPWCTRLMQLQVSIVYLRSVAWKLRGSWWRNGTAAFYPPQVPSFVRFRLPGWLCTMPFVKSATWGTLLVEFALGTWVWLDELRYPVLAAGVVFHLGLEILINIQLFGWAMIVSLTLFVHAADMERAIRFLI